MTNKQYIENCKRSGVQGSKAHAFIRRSGFVLPENIKLICHEVLRHRIGLTYEAEAENITQDDIISQILNKVKVP